MGEDGYPAAQRWATTHNEEVVRDSRRGESMVSGLQCGREEVYDDVLLGRVRQANQTLHGHRLLLSGLHGFAVLQAGMVSKRKRSAKSL